MIVRGRPGPLDLALALRGSVVPRILPSILVLVIWALGLVWLEWETGLLPQVGGLGFTVFGLALSLFLGFRNNAAYDRWWEARKLWGGLLADLRSLAREAIIFTADPALRAQMLRGALAFVHLHRANLRRLGDDRVAGTMAMQAGIDLSGGAHPPDAALDHLARAVAAAHRAGSVDGFGLRTLAERFARMADAQAGCERIALTPLPFVYSLLVYRTTWLFCLLLPLALIGPAGWMAPLFVAIVAYVFFGLAEVTEELTDPFAPTPNGLPLDAICRAAEISLAPHLGQPAPEPIVPRNFYLS